jgi:acyl dehydratase
MPEHESFAFSLGHTWSLDFTVSQADQALFAALSGDRNPLHLDAQAAARAGLSGPVVYGALLIAKLSSIIGMHIPGSSGLWSGLQIDFRRPLYVGQPATIEVELIQISAATRSVVLKVSVRSEGKRLATGKALATLFSPLD